jgi:hypothetical protein
MTFDLGPLALSASIAILALVSSAVALEAPRASDKAALAACLNLRRHGPTGSRASLTCAASRGSSLPTEIRRNFRFPPDWQPCRKHWPTVEPQQVRGHRRAHSDLASRPARA